jgi:hypothetical protein
MPIVFEQPDAVSAYASGFQGGGAADMIARTLPAISQATALNAHVQEGNAQRAQQSQEQSQHLAMQSGMADAQMRNQSGMQQQQLGAEQGMQAQRLQAAAQMQANQYTMADQLQHAKVQQGINYVQGQISSGNMTQEEGDQALAPLYGVSGKLDMKKEAAQAKQMQQQTESLMHQNAQAKALDLQDQQAQATSNASGQGVMEVEDANGDTRKLYYNAKNHEWYDPLAHVKPGKDVEAEQDFKEYQHVAELFHKFTTDAYKHITKPGIDGEPGAAGLYKNEDQADQARDRQMMDAVGARNPVEWRASRGKGAAAPTGAPTPTKPPVVQPSIADDANLQPPTDKLNKNVGTGPNPSQPQGPPPGYKTDPELPGYIMPQWWEKDTHYRVVADKEHGGNRPEMMGPQGGNFKKLMEQVKGIGIRPTVKYDSQQLWNWLVTKHEI